MTFSPHDESSRIEKLDLAHEELKTVEKELREERRIINRDWAQMSPRERSSQSRVVKDLESRHQILTDEIKMNLAP